MQVVDNQQSQKDESDLIIKHFTPQVTQNLKVLMYLNRVAKLKQDNTAFTPSLALFPVPVRMQTYKI